jgi:RPA family protein
MSEYKREVAHRIFAQELRDTSLVLERDIEDAYVPQYVVTPTGAKVNRVFIVGTLTEKEDIGTDAEYWRARISDPTGTFFVYAGQYQPDATRVVAESEVPEFMAAVGKVGVYTTEDDNVMTSIRPETVTVVDAATRDRWVVETARQTLDRMQSLEESDSPAKEHYSLDVEQYQQMIRDALEMLR